MFESATTVHKAQITDLEAVLEIISFAIASRKKEGSNQWQDGYPNQEVITNDIEQEQAYVVECEGKIKAYFVLIFGVEPAYELLAKESWQSNQKYAVVHRVAVGKDSKGRGLGRWILQKVEDLCIEQNYSYIRIDTNFDNASMLCILKKLGYRYCGKVYFRGSERLAFDKVLN
ncbi:MAG: GNAT family N-acetyltransferase [Bacteroidota bacterium]|nr:GNAT family N-acetyltransferase [Bacteroidota bacterium]